MKKIISIIFAVIFPCVIFFVRDNPAMGLVALVLQASMIGWPVVTIIALKEIFRKPEQATGDKAS